MAKDLDSARSKNKPYHSDITIVKLFLEITNVSVRYIPALVIGAFGAHMWLKLPHVNISTG
jgi:hypothetical protein